MSQHIVVRSANIQAVQLDSEWQLCMQLSIIAVKHRPLPHLSFCLFIVWLHFHSVQKHNPFILDPRETCETLKSVFSASLCVK